MRSTTTTHVWTVLRIGAALCFIGHGAFGLLRKEAWLPFFAAAGIGPDAANMLMPLVGGVDIALGVLALVSPRPAVFAYMALWGLWTAALRPLTGDSFAELAERAGNYGVPLALLAMAWPGRSLRGWVAPVAADAVPPLDRDRIRQILVATTAVLLAGHGFIALGGSALLAEHLAAVGLSAALLPTLGALEISAALALALRPTMTLALVLCAWKLASEALFIAAGAPVWEFVERGGSFAAPLALALMLRAPGALAITSGRAAAGVAALAAMLLLPRVAGAQESSGRSPDPEPLAELRRGGVILACRHAITDHDGADRNGRDYHDRAKQRNLSAEGEAQARRMGKAIAALRLPIADVLTSPMFRTRDSAELMFGRATDSPLLRMTPDSVATRRLFTDAPPRGRIRVLMTHTGVLSRHFQGTPFQRVPEGGCVVVRPDGSDTPRPVALITDEDWERR